MGLFDKKFCDICGEKISFLGNHKLEDGNMCGTCNKKMSPFFNGRRKTTVEEMKQHLAEREQNSAKLASFVVGSQFGDSQKIYIDAAGQNFMVTYSAPGNFAKENPDILPITAITSCNTDIKENREEEYTKDANGNRVSYNPPRYRYFYDFKITITLNWRWFNEITVKLNSSKVEGMNSAHYHNYEMVLAQARAALLGQPAAPVTAFNGGNYGGSYANNQGGFVQQFVDTVAASAAGGAVVNGAYGNDTAYKTQNAPYGVPNQPINAQNAPYGAPNQPINAQNAPYGAPNQPINAQNAPYGAPNQPINAQNAPYGVPNQPINAQNAPYGAPNQPINAQNAPYGAPNQPINAQNAPYGAPNQPINAQNAPQTEAAQAATWICPGCGTSNTARFCGNCGQQKPVTVKFCGNCGWKAEGDNIAPFCPQCGTRL